MTIPGNRRLTAIERTTWWVLAAALAFWAFFQLSKVPAISAVNPFADDPVDAIGSFAFQIAVVCAFLNLARLARAQRRSTAGAGAAPYRMRLIVNGSVIALGAIAVTLVADILAELQTPTWGVNVWGALLAAGLVVLAALALIAGITVASAARGLREQARAVGQGSLADTIEDLWLLVWIPLTWIGSKVAPVNALLAWGERLVRRVASAQAQRLAWISPRLHPWRFCALLALGAGLGLAAAHGLFEGPPANLSQALLVSGIFIGFETAAVLLCFLIFGGTLGIRPPLR